MIQISTDSTCDLSPELIQTYGISIAPLGIMAGGNSFKDGIDITPDALYQFVEQEHLLCQTTAVNEYEYQIRFAEALKTHDAIIHICISRSMSACYQNACLAAQQFENVYVIDSASLSTGIGHLVLDAALLAQQGVPAPEIVQILEATKKRLDVSFVIATLDYLKRGGRCSSLAALGGKVLRLKPSIYVTNGAMHVGKKYTGSMQRCLKQYVEERLSHASDLDLSRIFITHSGCEEEIIASVKDQVLALAPFREVLITRAGCTVSNHCGPGTLGILFKHQS